MLHTGIVTYDMVLIWIEEGNFGLIGTIDETGRYCWVCLSFLCQTMPGVCLAKKCNREGLLVICNELGFQPVCSLPGMIVDMGIYPKSCLRGLLTLPVLVIGSLLFHVCTACSAAFWIRFCRQNRRE
jgi:hypothetical protein